MFTAQAISLRVCQVPGETPRPMPCPLPPLVQAVLILFHLPTAWVAALYQVVGCKVHAINLRHQGLHLLVQDVKPGMDRGRTRGVVSSSRASGARCLLLSSFGFLPLHPECFVSRRKSGGRYAGIHRFLVQGFNFMP